MNQIIDITGKNLSQIPEEVFSQPSPSEIWLDNNFITEFEDRVFDFRQLVRLSAYNNKISKLPEWLFQMKTMSKLNLSWIIWTRIHKELDQAFTKVENSQYC
jgi:Leucine-rich repeat (LRR) protein